MTAMRCDSAASTSAGGAVAAGRRDKANRNKSTAIEKPKMVTDRSLRFRISDRSGISDLEIPILI